MGLDVLTNFHNSAIEGLSIGIGISLIALMISVINLLRSIASGRAALHIDFDCNKDPNTFCPAHGFGNFEQKYLRVRVRNNGWGVASNCSAYIHVPVPRVADSANYPSTELKPLAFGRTPDKTDLSPSVEIHPKIGHAILHVIFSDSSFANIPIRNAPRRYASISILERLQNNDLRVEDSFTLGDFDINLLVTSDRGHCKGKLRVHVDTNHLALSMTKLSLRHVIISNFRRFLSKIKKTVALSKSKNTARSN
jgi:hypothetical protein